MAKITARVKRQPMKSAETKPKVVKKTKRIIIPRNG